MGSEDDGEFVYDGGGAETRYHLLAGSEEEGCAVAEEGPEADCGGDLREVSGD